jgi:hypothetical protein
MQNQRPSFSAHSSSDPGTWLYRNITYLYSYVQFGFRTFNSEQDSVGGTVTRIRSGNREVVFGFQAEVNATVLSQQNNRPSRR